MSLGSTVDALIETPREVVAFRETLTIGDALDVMSHYEIFQVPLLGEDGRCVGEVDFLDLLCALVRLTVEVDESPVWPPTVACDLSTLTRRANDWTLGDAFELRPAAHRRPFFCVEATASVHDALNYMGAGARHVLVLEPGQADERGRRVHNLVSQRNMLAWLSSNVEVLGSAAQLTLGEVGLGNRAVHCVRNSDSALDAFFELGQVGYGGGAIINEQGKLVGNLSRHDLKGTQGDETDFSMLNQSIMHYQRKHRVSLAERLVTVSNTSTLGEVIATMARERVQRVFVTQQGMVPRGLVTQTDVCRVLAQRLAHDSDTLFTPKLAKKLEKQNRKLSLQFPLAFPPQ